MTEFKLAPSRTIRRTSRIGNMTLDLELSGPPVTNILVAVQQQYRKIAQDAVNKYAPEEKGRIVNVDGSPRTPISKAQLDGEGVAAGYGVDAAAIQRAYNAAISYLNGATSLFKKPTGKYRSAITTLQNGYRVSSPDFTRFGPESNLQVTVTVAHASPLEAITNGRLLLGAANAARSAGNVKVRFFYASGKGLFRSNTLRSGTFPVLEIGGPLSNVGKRPDSIPGAKAERKRRRRARDLAIVGRGI